jgi:outer membrane protein assembly factor BamB
MSNSEPSLNAPYRVAQNQVDQAPSTAWKPLRVWIPLLLLPVMLLMRFVPDLIPNGPSYTWMASAFGPFLIGLLVILWWLLLSRARWYERILGVVGLGAAVVIEQIVCDPSMKGPLTIVMTIPMAIAAFGIGCVLFGRRLSFQRTGIAIALAFAAAMFSALLRTDGVWGDFSFALDWRWSPSSEERAMRDIRQASKTPMGSDGETQAVLEQLRAPEWPGFRGPEGNSRQTGARFSDDWKTNPPKELWRIRLGPAWSSFAVAGDRIFTQEQREADEAIVCYDAKTGKPIWDHSTPSRFFESLGGLGPRATPAIANGSLYALGAEGILVRLNAVDGGLVWRVDLKEASGRKVPPMWGFSCSPYVDENVVIVHAGGEGDKGVLAFHVADGSIAWTVAAGEMSYSSVQKVTLLGQPYLCLLSNLGAHLWDPATGKLVFDYKFKHDGYRACQAQVVGSNKLLIPAGMGTGTRLVEFTSGEQGLEATELWTSKDMKPDFNDILVYDGNIYGFDNAIFGCVSLEDGKRKWKGGRYEKGQAFLLADSGLILVVSEKGELVLLRATPEKHQEIAKIAALGDKTWNHPVVVGNRLYLRNAQEAVCYELKTLDN